MMKRRALVEYSDADSIIIAAILVYCEPYTAPSAGITLRRYVSSLKTIATVIRILRERESVPYGMV